MKAIRLMMFVAAATMMFASCEKDGADLEDNQLFYDGKVYNLVSSATSDADGSYVSFDAVGREVLVQLSGVLEKECFNRTFNLAVAADDVHYNIDCWCEELGLTFSFDNNRGTFHGGMVGVPEGESIFSKGTCTITYDNDEFSITLDGTLKNNKKLAFEIDVPKSQIQIN